MRLKSIEIIGFKSFADRVKLEFNPGITGIVGPNGCGKSNIADAFRWVLGEPSAKAMRGNKMPDVIFAGTSTRKALNFAEVTITLTDVGGKLPTKFEEIAVTRRLHRNGESEYFINRHSVRLKDVHGVFLDSGIGKDAYSIFEQGKIDQVIQYTPLERRYIFEEAAGILRFLHRKREALRKLEQADINIARAKDIHLEVEKQITLLEQQAEKAHLYKENKTQLEKLEKMLLAAKWDHFSKKRKDISKQDRECAQQNKELNQRIENLLHDIQMLKAQHAEGENTLREHSELMYKTRSDKEIKSREKQALHERLKESQAKEKKWQQELEMMRDRHTKRQQERQQALKLQQDSEKELAAQTAIVQTLREKTKVCEAEVNKWREQQQEMQKELLKLTQEESRLESELKQQNMRWETCQERKGQVSQRQQKMSSQAEELQKQALEKQSQVQDLSSAIDVNKKTFAQLEEEHQTLISSFEESQKQLDALGREVTEIRVRSKMLQKLREEMEGFSAGSKSLLQEAANPKSPLFQKIKPLYEFILPETGSEAAVAAALKPYANTLVVLEQDFEAVAAHARKKQLKDYSLFYLPQQDPSAMSQKMNLAERAAQHPMAHHFLGRVRTVANLAEALQASSDGKSEEFWIKQGIFKDSRQVFFYASHNENNVFAREAELKSLDKRLKEREKVKVQQEEILKNLQARKTTVQNERIELDKQIRKAEMKLVEHSYALQRFHGDREKTQMELKQFNQELQTLITTMDQLNDSRQTFQGRYSEAKKETQETQKAALHLQQELERSLLSLKQEQRLLQEKEGNYHRAAEEQRKAIHALHVLDVKDNEGTQQEKRLEEEIKACRELQTQIKGKGEEFESAVQDVEKMWHHITAECAEWEKEVKRRRQAIEEKDRQYHEWLNALKKIESQMHQIGVQAAQVQVTLQTLETEMQERFQLTMEEARQREVVTVNKTIEQTERQIRVLRQELDGAGDINMTSIEEFDKHKSRYEFLNQQIDDMNVSRQELMEVITQLDHESQKIFQETFVQVKANFQKNFKVLFNGGEADLQFTESDNVLEAGIEIIAKPPGKQMRSISLLSGGEKCLTALALLFAIFEVKPAPYCILDEIDAPLDDTNVERFVNVVKQFVDRCQFIIITHNKRTMAIADVLFGVSMEEKGISKILSLHFAGREIIQH